MDPMPVVAGDAHRAHDPPYEVDRGRVVGPVFERAERAERLRGALAAAGHPLVEPDGHGMGPILAVHTPALVGFLETGWAAWRAAGGPEVLIPDTFAVGPLARGGGPGRGATLNLPLPGGTGDDAYLAALAEAMAQVAAFEPATLVVSAGFDTFAGDPLGTFRLTTAGFRRVGAALAAAGRPMVLVQEGGYALDDLGANAVALLDGARRP